MEGFVQGEQDRFVAPARNKRWVSVNLAATPETKLKSIVTRYKPGQVNSSTIISKAVRSKGQVVTAIVHSPTRLIIRSIANKDFVAHFGKRRFKRTQ